jgi:hypothetical protein
MVESTELRHLAIGNGAIVDSEILEISVDATVL